MVFSPVPQRLDPPQKECAVFTPDLELLGAGAVPPGSVKPKPF